jgi:hypothetical protein
MSKPSEEYDLINIEASVPNLRANKVSPSVAINLLVAQNASLHSSEQGTKGGHACRVRFVIC